MINIHFEAHNTTFDDENKTVSGWFDVRLSPAGVEQGTQLASRYAGIHVDAVFTADLKRCYQTATQAFDFNTNLIFTDWRLRECNYGDYNQTPLVEFNSIKKQYLNEPFPSGESYMKAVQRVGTFLNDLKLNFPDKTVMVVGDSTTQYALEYYINGKPVEKSLEEEWVWQPGWQYQLQ